MSFLKELYKENVEESDKLKSIKFKKHSKLKSKLISYAIGLFFFIPVLCIIINLLIIGNYSLGKVMIVIGILIIMIIPHFVYYDVLKYYNEEVKDVKLRIEHFCVICCALVASTIVFIIFR